MKLLPLALLLAGYCVKVYAQNATDVYANAAADLDDCIRIPIGAGDQGPSATPTDDVYSCAVTFHNAIRGTRPPSSAIDLTATNLYATAAVEFGDCIRVPVGVALSATQKERVFWCAVAFYARLHPPRPVHQGPAREPSR